MGYYGIVLPAYTGHLNPISVLGRALQSRGHRVVLISPLDAETKIRRAGLDFVPIATAEFPKCAWLETTRQMSKLSGWKGQFFCGKWLARFARGILRDLPSIAEREKFDGVVLDQVSIGAEMVCEAIRMPAAVACAALAFHFEMDVPPLTSFFRYGRGWTYRVRNLAAHLAANLTGWRAVKELVPFRLRHGLGRIWFDHMNELPPSLVQVSQQPPWFDFPRRRLPDHFHYTGPWKDHAEDDRSNFPWEALTGQPLIYASLGTLQNGLQPVFRLIAEACAGLGAQLVIALGAKGATAPAGLIGEPLVVDFAPQRELLRRAHLVITHGGLNTVLESLSAGVPMIALPIVNDQPGVAARIEYLGLGLAIPIAKLKAARLREKVQLLLNSGPAHDNAQKSAEKIRRGSNQDQAAGLIEQAFTRRCRIVRK